MAQLRLPITQSGPSLTVVITLPAPTLAAKQLAGQVLPASLHLRGIIDTGTDITAVAASFLQTMGLAPLTSSNTHTASGSVRVRLFEISLLIPASDPTVVLVVRPQLRVMELITVLPDVDLILGRDVLDECLFIYDGPGQHFLLAS
jgi:hypothetical protein